jgi:AhpC/TSA family protein
VMNTRLQNGDRFPDLSITTVGGGQMVLPHDVEGFYSVILFYRGAWFPYCKAQLATFARASLRTQPTCNRQASSWTSRAGLASVIGGGIWIVTNAVDTPSRRPA